MRADNKSFNTLLYADDLVLISKNANGLQILLNNLENYCSDNNLTVNIDKTKELIFNNNAKRTNNYKSIIQVPDRKCVFLQVPIGLIFSAYRNFKIAKHELSSKHNFSLKREWAHILELNLKSQSDCLSHWLSQFCFMAVRCGVWSAKEMTQTMW